MGEQHTAYPENVRKGKNKALIAHPSFPFGLVNNNPVCHFFSDEHECQKTFLDLLRCFGKVLLGSLLLVF